MSANFIFLCTTKDTMQYGNLKIMQRNLYVTHHRKRGQLVEIMLHNNDLVDIACWFSSNVAVTFKPNTCTSFNLV